MDLVQFYQAAYENRGSVDVYVSFLRPHDKTTPHYHDTFELLLLLEGETEVMLDGEVETARAGQFVMILPGQIHSCRNELPDYRWTCKFSADYVQAFADYMADKRGRSAVFTCDAATSAALRENLLLNERLTKTAGSGTGDIEASLFEAMPPEEKAPLVFAVKGCLYAICSCYIRQAELVPRGNAQDSIAIRLLRYVSENFRENITLRGVADTLGYSYNYLSLFFHKKFGINFRQFVNQYRLDYARDLIQTQKMDIGKAALASGFGSVRNFNIVCKQLTGKTPSALG